MTTRTHESPELRASRVRRVNQLLIDLDALAKKYRPFFCEKVFEAIDELLDEVDQEAVHYQSGIRSDELAIEWFQEGSEAGRRITNLAHAASNAIRTRTTTWDRISAIPPAA
ncbi:hypothetical protein D3C87_1709040 [compost metagenome]